MTITRTDLANGLTVVTEHMSGSRAASFGCWVQVGSRDEPAEIAGASHFLEHLLFRGTSTRTGREISEAIESVGGELNAHTGPEHTAFYTRVPASAADRGLELLLDVLTDPGFDLDDVEAERQVIQEELSQAEDDGDDRVHTLAQEALWGSHPLGREVLGTAETIGAMNRTSLIEFFDTHYRPASMVVVGAGDVDHERLVEAADRLDRSPGSRPVRTAPEVDRPAQSVAVLERPLEQAHLAIIWPGLAARDPDRWAQAVLNQIFGGGLSSRLFQIVREERGLAYSVFTSTATYSDAGSITAYAGTSPDQIAEVRAIIVDTAEALVRDGVTDREWSVARGYLEGVSQLALEDSGSVMSRLGTNLALRDESPSIDEQIERLRAVGRDDVRRVAARVLGARPSICAVGPVDGADLEV